MSFVFLDTETTGLDPKLHEIFEIAYVVDDAEFIESEFVSHTLRNATAEAMAVNGYQERRVAELFAPLAARRFEAKLFTALEGQTMVCANPHYDASMLEERWGAAPWHYRLLDIETYAMPFFGAEKPLSLAGIYKGFTERHYTLPEPDHTAAGDVATLRAAFYLLKDHYGAYLRV